MKTCWLTTETVDILNHMAAWNYANGEKAEHVIFHHRRKPLTGLQHRDDEILGALKEIKPELIIYLGSNGGKGNLMDSTLAQLRNIAPSIHLCCDAATEPWHPYLRDYEKNGYFDIQFSIDGVHGVPVDHVTVTPVNPGFYEIPPFEKNIKCGFSGNCVRGADHNPRWLILKRLLMENLITVRDRKETASPELHADFNKRCKIILNESNSGVIGTHHIKGRVMETPWAGAAILELEGSPIADWFPEGSYFTYRTPDEAAHFLKDVTDEEISEKASAAGEFAKFHYTPQAIYGGVLEKLKEKTGICLSFPQEAAQAV